MLPELDDAPVSDAEAAEVALVSASIGGEFVAPEGGELVFRGGQPPAVPEIAVHEHSHLLLGNTMFLRPGSVLT